MNTDANGYCTFASQSDPETFLDIKNCSGSDYTGRIKFFLVYMKLIISIQLMKL
jgi:hypothetical protein